MSSLEAPLRAILESVSGATAAALLGLDGMPVASAGTRQDVPLDLIAASYADLVRRADRCATECGLSETRELILASDRAVLVVRVVTPEYALVVVLEADGSLGRARYEMHKASLGLLQELSA